MIYLDYAANTPVDERVLEAFDEATIKYFGNPNSSHKLGLEAKEVIDKSTNHIIKMLQEAYKIDSDFDIIYTSGASESNNMAIKGIAKSYRENGKHIITSSLEHSSVSGPLSSLKDQGYEVDVLNIGKDGKIDLDNLKELIRKDTVLVSICSTDSELGTVQPINEISKILKDYPNCYFHVDATQSIGKLDIDLSGVDLITIAPHKFYGLNGFGALLKRKEIVLEPLIHGGVSTSIYRSGTPVIGQVVAFEKALEIALKEKEERYNYVKKLSTILKDGLKEFEKVEINSIDDSNPYILNLGVKDVKATTFKEELEKYDICISIKSACSVTSTPSRSVMSIYKDRKRAFSSFRISISHLTTEEEIKEFLNIFKKCYEVFS